MGKASRKYNRLGGQVIVGHESPHKFDQFSLDSIGTGQGAQSYTKGLYFWENPSIGAHYNESFQHHPAANPPEWQEWNRRQADRDSFDYRDSKNRSPYAPALIDTLQQHSPVDGHGSGNSSRLGRIIENRETYQDAFARLFSEPQRQELARLFGEMPAVPWSDPQGGFATFPVTKMSEMSEPYYSAMYDYLGGMPVSSEKIIPELRKKLAEQVMAQARPGPNWGPADWSALFERARAEADKPLTMRDAITLDRGRDDWVRRVATHYYLNRYDLPSEIPDPGPEPKRGPFTYHTKLNADRSDFPQLEDTIAGQEHHLRDALMDLAREADDIVYADGAGNFDEWTPLRDISQALYSYEGSRPARPRGPGLFENLMLNRNIPGVRYDDASSRMPDSDSSTQNFVVYDPSIIEIVKRYPYSLLAPLLLSQSASQQETPAASPLAGSLMETY
jgi:hypothetical protein